MEKSLWKHLQKTKKPIMLYGIGDGADKILKVCKDLDIKISGIFASDNYRKNGSFRGFKIHRYSDVTFDDFIILVAFGTCFENVMAEIYKMAQKQELYAPDVPVVGNDGVFDDDFVFRNLEKIKSAYSLLADDISRKVFIDTLNFKLSGKLKYLQSTDKSEIFQNILLPTDKEIFIDLGAYNGDTIRELLHYTHGKYKHITAFEPDLKTFIKLEKFVCDEKLENIKLYNFASSDIHETLNFGFKASRGSRICDDGIAMQAENIDNLKLKPTFIKMDVEGAEEKSIIGAINTIKKYKPKLNIAIYHRNDDFFNIINLVADINPNYKFYIRHHPYIPAWDTNLYAI